MSDNKRSGGFTGKGYYIALMLCVAAIGIAGYLYYQSSAEPVNTALQETQNQDIFLEVIEGSDVPVLATQPRDTTPVPTESTVPPVTKPSLKTMNPVSGDALFGYSMEALSYNQTTRDWRVHNGIDLAAEDGAQVCAAADGEVYQVFEDDAYGYTVVIRHNDGYTTRYASLTGSIPVTAGQQVTMGQTIGYAGDSAIVESTMGSHVHFSVTCYDEPMDPAEFFALGE